MKNCVYNVTRTQRKMLSDVVFVRRVFKFRQRLTIYGTSEAEVHHNMRVTIHPNCEYEFDPVNQREVTWALNTRRYYSHTHGALPGRATPRFTFSTMNKNTHSFPLHCARYFVQGNRCVLAKHCHALTWVLYVMRKNKEWKEYDAGVGIRACLLSGGEPGSPSLPPALLSSVSFKGM